MSAQSHREKDPITTADDNNATAKSRCCFCMPCLGSTHCPSEGSTWWKRMRAPENRDRWWLRGWKKIRDWSEIVAGPKWKTFVRRFNKSSWTGYGKQSKFQYDPLSYALNFDEGPGQSGHSDEDYIHLDFSSRYASIPATVKPSAS